MNFKQLINPPKIHKPRKADDNEFGWMTVDDFIEIILKAKKRNKGLGKYYVTATDSKNGNSFMIIKMTILSADKQIELK